MSLFLPYIRNKNGAVAEFRMRCMLIQEEGMDRWNQLKGVYRHCIAITGSGHCSTGHKATALVEGNGRLVPVEHYAAADKVACGTGYSVWLDDYSRTHGKQHDSRMVRVDVV